MGLIVLRVLSCMAAGRLTAALLLSSGLSLLAAGCGDTTIDTSALFGNAESELSAAEEAAAFSAFATAFTVSQDGSKLEDPNCGDIAPEAEVVDLNEDGAAEVFVLWGNTCTSGGAGRSLSLLVPDASGAYEFELGFPASGWTALAKGPAGWPDLSIGGPGFCRAVWSRTGTAYEFKCNLPESPGGCDSIGNVCQ